MARSVFIDLIGRDRASAAFDRAGASASAAASKMEAASARMTRAGAAMTRSITVPVIAALAVSAKMATDFNTSMTRIQTQAGASARDVQVLSKQVLGMKNAQQGPNELAKALYHLKSVGMDNKSAMSALRQSMALANVSGADLEETTNALAGAWRTGIRGAKDFHGTVSSLNAIVGSGNMTMSDLIGALGTGVLPAAKTFGLTIRDIGAALALFTDEGVPADAAATRIRMSISLLGAGSKQAQKQLAGIGLSSLKLNQDMRQPNGLLRAITDLKDHLDASGLSAAKQSILLSHAFGGGRSSSGILSMINNLDVLGQKYQQQTKLAGKFNDAVAAQAKTPAAQFHELTAELQKAAVLLGNAVLPDLVTLATDLTNVVTGFSNMSGTQKKIALWSIGIMAALGPVLTIGGRLALVGSKITGFAASAASKISTLAGASEATASRVVTITSNMVRGVQGALVGAAAGQMFGTSTGGWLGSILLGGAGGWALSGGNPVGLAVGAASAAISKGIGLWNDHKNAAKAAAEAEAGFVTNLTSAINADNGALGTNLRLVVTKQLQDSGILSAAQKLGFNLSTVVSAAMGSSGAKNAIGDAISKQVADASNMLNRLLKPLGIANEPAVLKGLLSGARPLSDPFYNAKTGNKVALSPAQLANAAAAIAAAQGDNKLAESLRRVGIDITNARTKADQFSHALNDNRVNTGSLASQIESLRKKTTVAEDANGNLTNSLRAGTVVGEHNRSVLISMANAALKSGDDTFAAALKHHTFAQAVQIASGALGKNIAAIESAAKAAGFNKQQVDLLINSLDLLGRLHPSVTPRVNNGPALAKIHPVGQALYALNAQKTDPTVTINDDATDRLRQLIGYLQVFGEGATATVNVVTKTGVVHARANGGGAPEGWFWTGERGPELVRKDGSSVHVFSNPQSRAMAPALGTTVPGFATGTTGNAAAAAAAHSAALGSVRGDFGTLAGALRSTAAELRSAFAALIGDSRQAKASTATINALTVAEGRLLSVQAARNTVTAQLTRAQAALAAVQQKYQDTFTASHDATLSSFDVTSAGQAYTDQPATAGSILSALRATAAKAGQFRTVLARLVREGLNATLVSQLAAAGPAALAQAQALAAATPAQMRSLNTTYAGLNVTSSAIGRLAATDLYGAGVASAQGLVNGLESRQTALNAAMQRIATGMVNALKRSLGIHSPSRVLHQMGVYSAQGFEHGIRDHTPYVRAASKDMGNAAVPSSQDTRWQRSETRQGHTFHIYETDSAGATAMSVLRRLDRPGFGSA